MNLSKDSEENAYSTGPVQLYINYYESRLLLRLIKLLSRENFKKNLFKALREKLGRSLPHKPYDKVHLGFYNTHGFISSLKLELIYTDTQASVIGDLLDIKSPNWLCDEIISFAVAKNKRIEKDYLASTETVEN